MPSNTRLHTELLITAGVRGLDRIDAVIEALRAAGHNTDQLTDESARLRAEWDSLDPEERVVCATSRKRPIRHAKMPTASLTAPSATLARLTA